MQDHKQVSPGGTGVFVRLYWLVLGNVLLLFLLTFIFERHPPLPSLLDVVYFVVVASLILARYIDIRFLDGETGEGIPATMTNWRRYTMLVGSVGVGAWLLARTLAHFLKQEA